MKRFAEVKSLKDESFEKIALCSYAELLNGTLSISIPRQATEYMLDYSKGFAEIDLKMLLSFRGGYEKRILEILSRFKERDYSTTLGELCLMLGTDFNDFSRFDIFKRTVLIRPIDNIVSKSNGAWTKKDGYQLGFELKKKGRSYTKDDKITFKMKSNQSLEPLSDSSVKKEDDRYAFVDYLSGRISSDLASSEEASVFLGLIKDLDIKYTNDFLEKAKKIAEVN